MQSHDVDDFIHECILTPSDSLSEAVSTCKPGTLVVLTPGTYHQTQTLLIEQSNVCFTTGGVIDGESPGSVKIIANSQELGHSPLLNIRGRSVSFRNIDFVYENDDTASAEDKPTTDENIVSFIAVSESSDATFQKCEVDCPGVAAFDFSGTSKPQILDCVIKRSIIGVVVKEDAAPVLDGCVLGDAATAVGIRVSGHGNPTVKNSTLRGCGSGVAVKEKAGGLFLHNRVEACQLTGVVLLDESEPHFIGNVITGGKCNGVDCHGRSAGVFDGNKVSDNGVLGFTLNGLSKPLLEGNHVSGSVYGVWVREESRAVLQNNSIEECVLAGLLVSDLAEPTVVGNGVKRNKKAGIMVQGFAGGEIRDNRVEGNQTNIQLTENAASVVVGNTIGAGTLCGVAFRDTCAATLSGNTLHGNYVNVLVMEACNPIITDNVVHKAHGHGIHLSESTRGLVLRNRVVGNGSAGITVDGSSRAMVAGNLVQGNGGCGISLGKKVQGRVVGNVLVGNAVDGLRDRLPAGAKVSGNVHIGGPEEGGEEGGGEKGQGQGTDGWCGEWEGGDGVSEEVVTIQSPQHTVCCGLTRPHKASYWLHVPGLDDTG